MTIREQFEAFYSDNGKTPHATEKLPNGEYAYMGAEHAWTVWQACAELKQPELDKANARIAQLEEALKQYVESDEVSEGGIWEEENKFWIAIKRNAQKLLTESSDTWLLEHDKTVEVKVLKEVVAVESMFGWKGVLDAIEARK